MIEFKTGDIFQSDCEALTNPVNTRGVSGAGLALTFKKRFPEMYKEYAEVCNRGELKTGIMHVWENPNNNPKYIVNFPTKDHWKENSKKDYIIDGLVALKKEIIDRDIKSIAICALGAGLGGLDYATDVKPLIEAFAIMLPSVRIVVYEPL